MNFRLLARVIGLLLSLESLAMLACGLFAYLDSGYQMAGATSALLISSVITFSAGALLVLFGRAKSDRIPRREGVMIVGLGWILSGVFCALPFLLAEPRLDLCSALFESVSGLTTTGATAIADLDAWPRGILMWRAVTQWLGGLGILVLFVAVLSYAGMGTKSLFSNESSFQAGEATTARIHDTAVVMWRVYLVMTAICFAGLKALGMTWFDAVAHTLTTVATGGFSPHNASIGHFSHWETGFLIELWIMFFMILCSLNFLIYALILKKKWRRLKSEEEGKWFVLIILVATLIVSGEMMAYGHPVAESLRTAVFNVISIASSTGYAAGDYESWPLAGTLIIMCLMAIGGCSGSTSGGLKVSRLLVAARCAHQEVVRAFRPNQVMRIQVNGNKLDGRTGGQAILFLALFGMVAFASIVVVGILETGSRADMVTVITSVLSSLGNTGPAFSELGPTDTFSWLRPGTKLFLSILMILGRLELFALLVIFVPSAWKRY